MSFSLRVILGFYIWKWLRVSEWQLLGLILVAVLFRRITTVTPDGVFIPYFNRYFLPISFIVVTILNIWFFTSQGRDGVEMQQYPRPLLVMSVALNLYLVYRLMTISSKKFSIEKKQELYDWLDPIIVAGGVAYVLITFIMRTYFIPSESMLPTLQKKDYIIVNKMVYRFKKPARNDIVVFVPPIPGEKRHFIKRVIGLPGETIKVLDEKVYINGTALNEPFIKEPPRLDYVERKSDDDKLLVMGDNRNDSDDSRSWGFLPVSRVEGKAIFIWWPPRRIGVLK